MLNRIIKYLFVVLFSFTALSCRLSRELQKPENKDKILLSDATVKLVKYPKKDIDHVSSFTLNEYIKQKGNREFLFNRAKPYTGLYLRAETRFESDKYQQKVKARRQKTLTKLNDKIKSAGADSTKILKLERRKTRKKIEYDAKLNQGTRLMRSINEPPMWVNDSLTKISIEQLDLFMHSKGFFNCTIDTLVKSKRRGRAITIEYRVTENRPHLFQDIKYIINDSTIQSILDQKRVNNRLKKGENYSVITLTDEREAIFNLLRNEGYFDFHRQFIDFSIDTLRGRYKANVEINIKNPAGSRPHTRYQIEEVSILIDLSKKNDHTPETFDGIDYYTKPNTGNYSKKVLNEEIQIRPEEFYSLEKSKFTTNSLGNLQIMKFVNISYLKTDSSSLRAIINLKTHQKFQMTSELGANLNVSGAQSIPGPYINFSLKDRKLFKGMESLEFNTNYTIQGQVSITQPDSIFRSREIGANLVLTFPRLIIPRSLKKTELFKRQNPFKNNISKKTKIDIGYSNVNRQEYTRSNLGLLFKYEWQKGDHEKFTFSPFEINVVNTPEITRSFQEFIDELALRNGINIKESFQPAVISNLSFGYVWSNVDFTKNKKAGLLRFNAELGGLLPFLISNATNNSDQILNLPYYKYYKLSADFRKYLPITKFSNLVFRTAGGYETPILNSTVLPYEKYFFTGGLSSNRAWPARRIGPGTYSTPPGEIDYERPGEILIEANIEYRTKVSGFFHTALFIDASNVWTNSEDQNRPGSEFKLSAVPRSLAIGGGLGLRFDFSLLIFRLDLGYQIYDPSRQSLVRFTPLNPLYNIGIGYPF